MGNIHPALIAIGALIFMCVIIFTGISHASGWAALAGQYRSQETFTGTCWSFQSGQMRWWTGYNNCLKVGGDPRGLYLTIAFPFLFLIGHPPLFIPWRDITFVSKRFLWVKYVELRLGRETAIPLRINDRLAQRLKSAAGSSWPIEAVA